MHIPPPSQSNESTGLFKISPLMQPFMQTYPALAHGYSFIVNGLLFILLAGSLSVNKALGTASVLLLLMALAILPFSRHRISCTLNEKLWIIFLILAFVSGALGIALKNPELRGWSNLDVPSRFLLVIPVFFLFQHITLKPAVIWCGIALGAITAGGWSLYQKLFLDLQAHGTTNHHIVFGDIALCLAFMTLAGISFWKRFRLGWLLASVCILSGIAASVLSGARGGWIALPGMLLMWLWLAWNRSSPKLVVASIVLTILTGIAAYSFEETAVKDRINAAHHDVKDYFEQNNHESSLGARLKMFHAAWLIFLDHPLTGSGTDTFVEEAAKLNEQGLIPKINPDFTHPHNEYLSALSMRGIIGLLILLGIFSVPLIYFYQMSRNKGCPLATAGVMLVIGYCQFGFSEAILDRMLSLMFYLFVVSALLVAVKQQNSTTVETVVSRHDGE